MQSLWIVANVNQAALSCSFLPSTPSSLANRYFFTLFSHRGLYWHGFCMQLKK